MAVHRYQDNVYKPPVLEFKRATQCRHVFYSMSTQVVLYSASQLDFPWINPAIWDTKIMFCLILEAKDVFWMYGGMHRIHRECLWYNLRHFAWALVMKLCSCVSAQLHAVRSSASTQPSAVVYLLSVSSTNRKALHAMPADLWCDVANAIA